MRRLLFKSSFKELIQEEGLGIDIEDTYQVYATVCDKFQCEKCGKEDLYREAGVKFSKQGWIGEAARKARADGWKVGDWNEGGMDCTAYCVECREKTKFSDF
jgi:hypothetical protein